VSNTPHLASFAVIATASKEVRAEIGPTGWFTALPGFNQPGIATLALADQARRAVRRRGQVATAAVTAAYDAAVEGTPLAEQFARHPALKGIDADAIEQGIADAARAHDGTGSSGVHVPVQATSPEARQQAEANDAALVAAARMVKAALGKNKGGHFTEEEAEEFREFLHHLRLAASDLVDLLVAQPAHQGS
jgi:hypothetical protein